MAKVNGVPGFTNFKKVNILDTLLIQGNPIGQSVATEDLTITGNWTFENDVGFSGAIQLEDESGTFQSALFYDTITTPDSLVLTNPITNGDIDFRTNGTGNVLVNGTSPFFDVSANYTLTGTWDFDGPVEMIELELSADLTGADATFSGNVGFSQNIQLEDESATFQNVLFYDTTTAPDTVVLTNEITNGDIDLRTNGTGQVLVNGANPFFDTAANYTVTGDWTFTQDATFQSNIIAESDIQINGTLSFQDSSLLDQEALFYDLATTPDTIVLTNSITNGDVDIRTNGTGQFLVNGSPIGGAVALANDEYITGEDTLGTPRNLIGVDTSDRTVIGNATFDLVLYSSDTGRVQLIENETGGLDELHIDFMQTLDGTIKAQLGFVDTGSDFKLVNNVSGGDLILGSTGAASVFALQRDGSSRLSINTNRTQIFDGQELANPAFVSEDFGAAGEYSGLKVAAGGSTLRSVGFNQMNVTPFTTGAFNFFFKANCNNYYSCDGSGALTLTLQEPGLTVDGQMVMITNTGAGGSTAVTINDGAQTLNWFDGSSVTTGNRSLAVGGICTIIRRDSGVFDIFGSGLS